MFVLRPIYLGVKRGVWRQDDPDSRESDEAFRDIRSGILERDGYRCQFCGFRAEKWQEVHHVDDDHSNNVPENLVTACCYCHACHHLGLVGMKSRMSRLIWFPWKSQSWVNCVARASYIYNASGASDSDGPLPLMLNLLMYQRYVTVFRDEETGEPGSPLALANWLLSLDEEEYARRYDSEFFRGLRLLPGGDLFSDQNGWYAGNLDPLPSEWADLAA